DKKIRAAYGIPKHHTIHHVVAIGYRKGRPLRRGTYRQGVKVNVVDTRPEGI
ncbi:hypothetical protein KIPB_010621, partial [Kipferlia bialata]